MSIHPRFDNPTSINGLITAPIVLRFASMFPRDLKRRDMHDKRNGGDLSHIRTDLSHLNTELVGATDWIDQFLSEVTAAQQNNFEEEIAARVRKGRHLEAEQVRERGTVDPSAVCARDCWGWPSSAGSGLRQFWPAASRNQPT